MSKTNTQSDITIRQATVNAAVKMFFKAKEGIQRQAINTAMVKYAWMFEKATGKVDVADLLLGYRAACQSGNPKLFLGNATAPATPVAC
jgi:hypothetical protein